jgi:ribose transport system substrate-binding protein
MKRNFRTAGIVLAGMLACMSVIFSGCSKQSAKDATVKTGAVKPKVGIVIWGSSDALARMSIKIMSRLVELSGGETVINTDGYSPEIQIQAVENLIAGGCNGIIIVNSSDTMLPRLAQLCENNQVYWGLMWRRIMDPAIAKQVESSKYFVGYTAEDEEEIGYRMGKVLADSGCKECAVITRDVGDTTHDSRNRGFDKACAETGLKRVAEVRGSLGSQGVMEAVEKFIIGYPHLDSIFLTGGTDGFLEGALSALDKHGKRGKIKVAVVDFIDAAQMKNYLKDGTLYAISGGHYVDPVFTMSMLVNAIQGSRLSDKAEGISLHFIKLNSYDDAVNYYKYVENEQENILAYNDDELKQMIKKDDPALTIDDLHTKAASYSIDDVMTRHGNK